MIGDTHLVVVEPERLALVLLGFELWEPHSRPLALAVLAVVVVLERGRQVSERTFGHILRHFHHPREAITFDGVEVLLDCHHAVCLTRIFSLVTLPLRQTPVVHPAGCAAGFAEVHFLLRRGMRPYLVRLDHSSMPSGSLSGSSASHTIA